MNKSESKYFNTAKLMNQALITLLEKKDLEYITVKEICEKAGVTRSTFYLHYETISDLLDETMTYIRNEFLASFETDYNDFSQKVKNAPLNELVFVNNSFLEPYLKFIYENRIIFKASFNNPKNMGAENTYSLLQSYVVKPVMERFEIPVEAQCYWMRYYIGGISAIIQEWINRDCKESMEQIMKIIIDCVHPNDGR